MKVPKIRILKYEPRVYENGRLVNRYRLDIENLANMLILTTEHDPNRTDEEQKMREVDLAIEAEKFLKEHPA
jgi:hypothetical protein